MPGDLHIRLVFFGDSICFGQHVSPHLGWVTRIGAHLHRLASEEAGFPRVRVTNSSVNGNTTRMALERMPFDVQSDGADVCLVQFGLNDCNHWQADNGLPRVSPAAFAANLAEILDRARRCGARAIILNTNHPTTRDEDEMMATGRTYEDWNGVYNNVIRRVAEEAERDVSLNDIGAQWRAHLDEAKDSHSDLVLADGLHLSERGHDLYFAMTVGLIENLIRGLVIR